MVKILYLILSSGVFGVSLLHLYYISKQVNIWAHFLSPVHFHLLSKGILYKSHHIRQDLLFNKNEFSLTTFKPITSLRHSKTSCSFMPVTM